MANYSIDQYGIYNFEMMIARDMAMTFEIWDVQNDVAVDITEATITCQAREFDDLSSPTVFQFTIYKSDPVNGKFQLKTTAEDTATLADDYSYLFYDILYHDPVSGLRETYVKGKIELIGAVTNYA